MQLKNVRLVGKLQNESFTKKDGTVITNSSALFQENNANYSYPFKVDFYSKGIDLLDSMIVNNDYDISVNMKSNEFTRKDGELGYITKITCYAAAQLSQSQQTSSQAQRIAQVSTPMAMPNDDDLPF